MTRTAILYGKVSKKGQAEDGYNLLINRNLSTPGREAAADAGFTQDSGRPARQAVVTERKERT